MSLDLLRLIPVDAAYVPNGAARQRAVAALEAMLPEGRNCEAIVHERIQFIDQGENIEAIICPLCATRLPLHDHASFTSNQTWWHHAVDRLEATSADQVTVVMPCCSRSTIFASLQFDWPAGFAKFELTIEDASIGENLSAVELKTFEDLLGCRLLQVRAHY